MPSRAATITGVGFTDASSPNKETRSRSELDVLAVSKALQLGMCARREVDAVVVGNIDAFEGSVLAGRRITRELGLPSEIPVTIVNTGGTTGGNLVHVAARMVRSGHHRRVLCVGSSTFFGARDLQAVINTNSPMVVEQPLGMGAVHMGAFFPSAYSERYGTTERDFAVPTIVCHEHALKNPYAHLRVAKDVDAVVASRELSSPLRMDMVCPVSTGAVAILVDAEDVARHNQERVVVIKAIGSSSDTYLGGGRGDFAFMQDLADLAQRVFRLAGVGDPRRDLDVAELFAPYGPMLPMQLEALGVCQPGEGISFLAAGGAAREGQLPTNLSGGPKCTNAGVAGELAPYAHVALQLLGRAPRAMQVSDARRGLAHGTGGTFFQFNNLCVMEVAT